MSIKVFSKGLFNSIDQFSLLKQIGVGSFGVVMMVLHLSTNKFYAIKIISLDLSENELLVLQRQIYIHSRLDHPHIIKLWDTFVYQNTVYMVMELAENGSLFFYQNQHGALSQADSFRFFQQTLSAVSYMHGQDVMHRDIKPENILLDKNLNVKVCDMGWATEKILSRRTTFCGTYEYMAPEMVFERDYNYKVDIWALGVLLYELSHGFAPYRATKIEEMKIKLTQAQLELNLSLPAQLRNLISSMLQQEQNRRIELKAIPSQSWVQNMTSVIREEAISLRQQLASSKTRPVSMKIKEPAGHHKNHRKKDSTLFEGASTQSSTQNYFGDSKTRFKHQKCKTQGSELGSLKSPIAKYTTSEFRHQKASFQQAAMQCRLVTSEFPSEKENSCKNDKKISASTLKMKRFNEKIKQISSKYSVEPKKMPPPKEKTAGSRS